MTTTPAPSELTVLVIDDQEEVRSYVRTILTSGGITKVVTATGGRQALLAVTEPGTRFDLILCDLHMPDRDGVETMRSFAALGIDAWFVVLSIEDERMIETAGLLAEAQGLRLLGTCQKPLDAAKLRALLERMRGGPRESRDEDIAAPETDLKDAFARGELRLLYQPKVHMRTGEFAGVEALVRWKHPTLGLFQPGAFVPMIERSESYTALLTDYSLQAAIANAGQWRRNGRDLRVAINLSASAFDRLDLPERIETLARAADLPNDFITLEVTETQIALDATRMVDVATRLRLKGFHLSVDDFGTGQSGLLQLRKLPFDELKIDRKFVNGCTRSSTQRSVVEASLSLAQNLKMTTVAEGVETRSEWNLLTSLGCDETQGYYVARPMSQEGLATWTVQWEARRSNSPK